MSIGDLSAIGAAACWSVSVILMRVSGLQIPPLPLTFFKNCVALLCLAALMLWLGEDWLPELTRGEYVKLVISALLGISFADTMIAAALNRLGASLHALADCVYTPAMACVGFLMFQEVPSVWEVLGGSLVVSGVFVGAAMTAEVKKPRDLWMGFVLAAAAHIIMAVGILMVRDIFRETSLVWVTGFRFLVASLGLLGWAAVKYPKSLRVELFAGFFRPDTWRTMIPMAIFGPFAATLFWVAGFKHLEVGRAAIFNQLSTVFIILMAYIFLKERFTRRKAIGSVLALGGAVLVAAHSPSATEEAPGDGSFEGGGVADEAHAEADEDAGEGRE
jgi:drug/metabolite transporter (DMT)-like permease